MKMSWLSWKTLAVGVVGLVVLGPLIKQLPLGKFPQVGTGTSAPATQSTATPQGPVEATPVPRATGKNGGISIDGKAISAAGQPTVLLNPGLVRPGTKVAVSGFGFDAGSVVDVLIKNSTADTGNYVSRAKVDQTGSFSASFYVPQGLVSRHPTVLVQERNSNKAARTQATVPASMASVKLGKMVGKPGDMLSLSASGFLPGEEIKVYWGQLYGDPAATLHADGGGNIGQASLRIPVGAVGTSNLVLIGAKSQSLAVAQFIMLNLYPSVKVAPYALKANNRITLSGKGFGPSERILVYINSMNGPPLMIVQSDVNGAFGGVGFVVPFGLKNKQTLILLGEESRAMINTGFTVLPYMPSVQPSAYGAFPGTTLSFYASGFAPNEVALIYKNRGANGGGQLIGAFRVDERGRAAAAGRYVMSYTDQGKVVFSVVGRESDGVATAAVTVQHSDVPVEVPPQPRYVLPPELQDKTPIPGTAAGPAAGADTGAGAAAGGDTAGAAPDAGSAGGAAGGGGDQAPAPAAPAAAPPAQ